MADCNKRIIQNLEDIITSSNGGVFEIQNYEIINHNCGITLVKYRKKMRNLLHLASAMTTVGLSLPFTLAINYMVKDTWFDCYFETASGEFLAESHNDAAEAIKMKGFEAITKGNFAKAKRLFNEAIATCDEDYTNRETFVNLKYAMDFALDGVNYLKHGRFKEASEKFQEVINRCGPILESYKFITCKSATEIAHEALDLLTRKEYKDALKNFEDAHNQTDIYEIKVYYYNYKEVVEMIINAHNLLAEYKIRDADELLCTALRKTSCIVINQILSNELDNVRKKEQEAANLYQEGMISWNKAWFAENNQETRIADSEFEKAKQKFEEAYNINQNSNFKLWISIIDCKIEGNKFCNIVTKLQEMNNNCNEDELYQEAYNMYVKSEYYFQEGYNLSNDQRFEISIEFAKECKNEIKKIIDKMSTNIQVEDPTICDYGCDNITHDSTEHQYIFEQNS